MNRYVHENWGENVLVCADASRARAYVGSILGTAILSASILSSVPAMLLTSQRVHAQGESVLEEIVVTARKREETALEIPESLSAFSSSIIERANIEGLEDIGLLVPNLYMSRRADGFPNVSIRGLGAFGNTQGVGFYLDDVQLFSDASSRFGDMERIEVLKGPQGILYGGANIGGAVKFVSKKPDPEAFKGRIKLKAGEDNYYDGEVQLNIPLGGSWATRIYGFAMTDDSYLRNPNSPPRINGGINNNDPDIGETQEVGMRATLAGNITDRFSIYATVRYNDLYGPNNFWSLEVDNNLTHTSRVEASYTPKHKRRTYAGSLELSYDFDNFTVTSISSYTDTDSDRETDLDQTHEWILDLFRPHRLDVITQELRFTSSGNDALQWQAGGYFMEYRRKFDSVLLARGGFGFIDPTCCPVPPPVGFDSSVVATLVFEDSHREREQTAGYANASYRWEHLELSAGFRVDRWESERTNRDTDTSGRQSETEILGRGSISWHFNDDRSMVYGLVSQGFEPGDFNLTSFAGQDSLFGYGPEEATQFEIGYKSQFLGGRIALTLASFYIDYNDRQFELQTTDPTTGGVIEGIINAGDSKQWGFEGDIVWTLHENWTFSGGVGYIDAEWDDGTISPVNGADLSGRTPPNTADWSATASLDYERQFNEHTTFFGRLQLRHKSSSATNSQFFDVPGDAFPEWKNPAFTVVDLGAWVEWHNWEIGIHVENLFDEEYYIDVQEFPNFAGTALLITRGVTANPIIIGTLEQPRRVVGSIQYKF